MENCIINTSGLEQYTQENQQLADAFLQTYFYDNWHKSVPHNEKKALELIISPKCNLGCKYCYVHRYRKYIFDESIFDEELTIKHLKLVLKWLEKNEFNPDLEIFSGELFAQEVGFKVLDVLYEYEANISEDLRSQEIMIPTNFTFLNSKELSDRIENMKNKFWDLGVRLHLSASFDGFYMEENRPYTKELDFPINTFRDTEYYDKVFAYCKKNTCGLHPMVYSKNIEKWKDNFLWFQENMAKNEIPWDFLYLLQVRNEEWNQEQLKELEYFIDFLYSWVYEKLNGNINEMVDFVVRGHGFNILGQPFAKTNRGMTCAIQSHLTIRLSDLMVYPCHRLGYKHYYYGQFVEDSDKILKYINNNVELMIAVYGADKAAMPTCSYCGINQLCGGQCFGACHESNKNLFVPIPSVCSVAYTLIAASIKNLVKYDAYNQLLSYLDASQIFQVEWVKKELGL